MLKDHGDLLIKTYDLTGVRLAIKLSNKTAKFHYQLLKLYSLALYVFLLFCIVLSCFLL